MDVPNQMQVRKKKKLRKKIEPFLYLLPALLFFVGFTYYPFAKTIFNSFFLVNSMGEIREFVGLENYISVLTNSAFLQTIKNTLIYVVISSPVAIFIALLLAMIANKKTKMSPLYETLYAITMAVSMSVAAMIFQLMYNPTIGEIQDTVYNWFLKGNNIPSGRKNYSEVVALLMAVNASQPEK